VYADDGVYTVTVTVTDDDGAVVADTFIVTVGNVAPVVDAGADKTVDEAATFGIAVSYEDAGSGDTHTATIDWGDGTGPEPVPAMAGGVAGTHSYPDEGVFRVTVTVTDDDGAATSDSLLVTVVDVAAVVTIVGDFSPVKEGVGVAFSSTLVDPGVFDVHTLSWQVLHDGALYASGAGSAFSFVPDEPGFFAVSLVATDQHGLASVPAVVDVTAFVDASPVARDDAFSVQIGTTLNVPAPGVIRNDTDAERQALTATLIARPANGTVVFTADGSFSYTHDGTQTATDRITYLVSDGRTVSEVATVRFTITGLNRPPTPTADNVALNEDSSMTFRPLDNDSDPDGDELSFRWVNDPLFGSLVLNPDGTYTYVPAPDWNGTEILEYVVGDRFGVEVTSTVHIRVRPVNDAPVAHDQSFAGQNGSLDLDVLSTVTDVDGDPLTLTVTQPRRGKAIITADGLVRYTPLRGFEGTDVFTFTADDGNGGTVTAQIQVQVTGGVGGDDLVIGLVSLTAPVAADPSLNGVSLAGMRLLVGSVMQTFDLLRLPLFVLALAFGLSLWFGLSKVFVFGSGPVYLPPTKPENWAVVLVEFGAVLPVRAEPGEASPIVHQFTAGERDLRGTGRRALVSTDMWVEVETGEGDGWVEATRVTRQIPQGTFAGDDRPVELTERFAGIVDEHGSMAEVTGDRGLHIAHFAPPEAIAADDILGLLDDATVWSWWSRSGSIQELDGTFAEIVARPLAASIRRNGITHTPHSYVDIPLELRNFPSVQIGDADMPGKDGWRVFFDYTDDGPVVVALWREGLPNPSAMGNAKGRRMLVAG
jgi:VCBS repeat-containing protein